MKPMYALHKDSSGQILSAGHFGYDFELQPWLRKLDLRAGDRIEFGEVVTREAEASEPATPAFLVDESPTPAVPEPEPATAGEDQPF
jgi:hypothetical protein